MDWTEIDTKSGDEIARVRWGNGEETAFIDDDDDAESPREWDPLGHLCMWHDRYDFPCETEQHGWYSKKSNA